MSPALIAVVALAVLPGLVRAQAWEPVSPAGPPAVQLESEQGPARLGAAEFPALARTHAPEDSVPRAPKSPDKAYRLSLLATVVPVGLGIATGLAEVPPGALLGTVGLLAGPAVGYFYGGATGRGLLGIGIRTAAVAVASAILSEDDSQTAVWIGGTAVVLGSAIWDIAKVKGTVAGTTGGRGTACAVGDARRKVIILADREIALQCRSGIWEPPCPGVSACICL